MKILPASRGIIALLFLFFSSSNFLSCACLDATVGEPAETVSGQVVVNVTGLEQLSTNGEKKYVTVSYSGNLENSDSKFGETAFSVNRSYEIKAGSVHPNPSITRVALKYGTWTVRVQADAWSSQCSCKMDDKHSPRFVFTYPNSQGVCQ